MEACAVDGAAEDEDDGVFGVSCPNARVIAVRQNNVPAHTVEAKNRIWVPLRQSFNKYSQPVNIFDYAGVINVRRSVRGENLREKICQLRQESDYKVAMG